MSRKLFWIGLILIVLLGLGLRWKNLGSVPLPGQSQDEYSNAWVGLSIIQSGVPVGMSGMAAYTNERRVYINPDRIFQQSASGDATTINYPWFDHPPLVPLITGGFAYFKGARVFEDVSAITLRKPVVALAGITILLTGLLALELFGSAAGILAALFYAISPLTTITNRMVQAENFLTPAVLLAFYTFLIFCRTNKKIWWYMGATALAVAVLMKLSSLAFVIIAMILLRNNYKQKWPWVMTGVFSLAAIMLWVVWGVSLSASTFYSVLVSNSSRTYGIGYQAVSDLLTTVKVTGTKTITDGWVLASFLGLVALMVSEQKKKMWIIGPVMAYLVFYLFLGSESYGWYRLPFFPFTFIALGYLTTEIFKRAELGGALLFLIPLGISSSKVIPPTGSWLLGWRFVPLLLVLGGYFIGNKKLNRLILGIFLLGAIVASLIYNLKIDINFWYQLS